MPGDVVEYHVSNHERSEIVTDNYKARSGIALKPFAESFANGPLT